MAPVIEPEAGMLKGRNTVERVARRIMRRQSAGRETSSPCLWRIGIDRRQRACGFAHRLDPAAKSGIGIERETGLLGAVRIGEDADIGDGEMVTDEEPAARKMRLECAQDALGHRLAARY